MKQWKYVNRIIIGIGEPYENNIRLAHSSEIEEVAYNTGEYAWLYRLEDGIMSRVSDDEPLTENDFDELYEEYTDFDKKCKAKKFFFENEEGDKSAYKKADWGDYDHYMELVSEHGINISRYDVTEAEIVEGVCYKAEYSIPQNYPHKESQRFYKFVADDGREFYVEETCAFFQDECDNVFELITKDVFDEYDK